MEHPAGSAASAAAKSTVGAGWATGDIAGLWRAMVSAPATGVTVVTMEGRILFANDQIVKFVTGESGRGAEQAGRHLGDLFARDWVEERLRLLAEVVTTGEPIVVRAICRGEQMLSWWNRIRGRRGGESEDHVLIVTRPAPGEDALRAVEPGVRIVEASTVRLGPLDVLTGRELEVLALLGQGLSVKEIARVLSRSFKTISRHRDSIGKKLMQSDRLKIGEMAWRAGLTVADAARERV